jgi:aromatic ring-opening dioxygenase LigB subunit
MNISKVISYAQSVPIYIRWGEAVPLWFLRHQTRNRYVFLSQPQKRYLNSSDFVKETKIMGEQIGKFIDLNEKSIIVIVSADLAHTHQKEGPYGYYKHAEVVDSQIEQWVLDFSFYSPLSNDKLSRALCCGYTGLVLLNGILSLREYKPRILTRSSPTYYGMMVGSYYPA